ncbi:Disco-interacting protein [Acrasis kona]|uniref:Disco-interacting protein n=1 Tax=Acrasis kona TaxID=1008807 RepID=A0AAW2ZK51_9EUKA
MSIDQKIQNVSKDICESYSQKITEALFHNHVTKEKKRFQEINNVMVESSPTSQTTVEKTEEPPKETTLTDASSEQQHAPGETNTEDNSQTLNATEVVKPGEAVDKVDEKLQELVIQDKEERRVSVEFDWDSFRDLFQSLVSEGAEEVIDTILESLVSKDCAVSLLSTLLEHCKHPSQTEVGGGGDAAAATAISGRSKHGLIRGFLQSGLKRYIIKYSEDPNEWGYYKDGVLCDVVEIDVTDNEEINWIFRDVTQNIEHCTEMQQFAVVKHYIPEYQSRIRNVFLFDVKLTIDWASIDYAAQDYAKAVYTIYHEKSAYVLGQILEAFEWICTYEEDDLVDSLALGLSTVNVTLQPGNDATRKDFDIDVRYKTLTLRLCLEADEFQGVFRKKDLLPIIKVAGLYDSKISKLFKNELLSAAACTYKVPRGDLSMVRDVLSRTSLGWWAPNQKDQDAIDSCRKFIESYYKKRIQKWNSNMEQQLQQVQEQGEPIVNVIDGDNSQLTNQDIQHQMQLQQQYRQISNIGPEDSNEELLQSIEDFEQIIKAWHVIKFNKRSMHQERYLVLTNKAYWTFKYDPPTSSSQGSVDEKHFKRHDLCDFCVADIGNLEQTSEFTVQALKVFTFEKRKKDMFGHDWSEVRAGDRKGKLSGELRKSLTVTMGNTGDEYEMLGALTEHLNAKRSTIVNQDGTISRKKVKKADRERPNTVGCYSSIFLPFGQLEPQAITDILTEIAWCIYAAAVSRQKHRGLTYEPFMNQIMTIPKKGLGSKLYNILGVGLTTSKKKNSIVGSTSSPSTEVRKPSGGQVEQPKINIEVMKKHQPVTNSSGKVVNGILKPPKPPVPDSEIEDHSIVRRIVSHDRRITFKPQVQVFYTGDNQDGESTGDKFFAVSQSVEGG